MEITERHHKLSRPFYSVNIISKHCVKSVQIRSFFWSAHSHVRTEYVSLIWFVFCCIQSEYSKIKARENSVFGHFSRSESSDWIMNDFLVCVTFCCQEMVISCSNSCILEVDRDVPVSFTKNLQIRDHAFPTPPSGRNRK